MAILHGDALSYFGVAGTIPKCQPLLSFRLRPKEAIMVLIVIGALLFMGGVIFMAGTAIFRGRMSSLHRGATLEPDRRSLRFLGLSANWPGIVLMVAGAVMLLSGAFAGPFS